ncbi:nucleotidyltransferase family protein [Candidatus Omnitrophota bacterium]
MNNIIEKHSLNRETRLICHFIHPGDLPDRDEEIERLLKEGVDWDLFYKIADYQEVSEIVYANITDLHGKFIPKQELSSLKEKCYTSILHNQLLLKELNPVVKELDSNNIRFVLFKGIVFNSLIYPLKFIRRMDDIDIMIQKEQFPETKSALTKLGYRMLRDLDESNADTSFGEFAKYDSSKNITFMLDIQWGHESLPRDSNKNALSDLWQRVRTTQLEGFNINHLSPEDMLFNLFFHQRRLGKPFTLKNILDITHIINKYKEDIDWDFIVKQARLNRITSLAYFCLIIASELFNCYCPTTVLKQLEPSLIRRRLFNHFFLSGLQRIDSRAREELVSHFIFMSPILYDRIVDLLIYINSISFYQFIKICGFKHCGFGVKILFRLKSLFLPILALLKLICRRSHEIKPLKCKDA